ncbi:MAG: stalk domain-containing protein [bacterium]
MSALLFSTLAAGTASPGAGASCLKGGAAVERELTHASGFRVLINGVELKLGEPLWVWRGVGFLPLENGVLMKLNLKTAVFEEGGVRVLSLSGGGREAEYTEGSCMFLVNGEARTTNAAPLLRTRAPAIPVRSFFSDVLGGAVQWDGDRKTVRITIERTEDGNVYRLPPGFFAPGGEQPAETAAVKAEEEPVSAAGAPAETAGEREKPGFQYTYENTTGVDSSEITGSLSDSYVQEESVLYNLYYLRLKDVLDNGYEMNAIIRTIGTTDEDRKKFEFDKLTLAFEKEGRSFQVYDVLPRFSRFLLRDYRLQGIMHDRKAPGGEFSIIAGKTPKELRDSEYARYVAGARIARNIGSDKVVRMNFVGTRDTGTARSTEKINNRVISLEGAGKLGGGWEISSEYAGSRTSGMTGGGAGGRAVLLRTSYKSRRTRMNVQYERTGADFVSETSLYAAGRSEFAASCQRKPSERTMYALGFKNRLYGGSRTFFYPVSLTLKPAGNRKKLKLELGRDYQRTIGADPRLVDEKSVSVTEKFGTMGVDFRFVRRKNRDSSREVLYRNTRALKLSAPLSPRLYTTLRLTNERRQGSSTPVTRFGKVTFEYELKAWTDFVFSLERYYQGGSADRFGVSAGFGKVNIYDDWEIGLNYSFYNYRTHNDSTLKLRYSFLR